MTKVLKNRVVWLDRGWTPISFGFCPNEKAWNREMKRLGISIAEEPYPNSAGRCTQLKKKNGIDACAIVTIQNDAEIHHSAAEIVGLLFHEATHVWQFAREIMGEHEPAVEQEAYAIQAIGMELLWAFEKTRCPLTRVLKRKRTSQVKSSALAL